MTGAWRRRHSAVRSRLIGSASDAGVIVDDTPRVGARLLFVGQEPVLTSLVQATERPPIDAICAYSSGYRSGSIG